MQKPTQDLLNSSHFKKNYGAAATASAQTIGIIAEESEQPSSSITPIGASSKGATPTINDDQMFEWPQQQQQQRTTIEQNNRQEAEVGVSTRKQQLFENGPDLPHFHLCQNIISEEQQDASRAEQSPGQDVVLTPMGGEVAQNAAGYEGQKQEFSQSLASSALMSQTLLQNRPFRSVSPVKTLKLLRNIENLKPRSEQNFMEVIEKDMSSSEESSPMYQRFKQKKQFEQQKQLVQKSNNSQIAAVNSNNAAAAIDKPQVAATKSPSHQSSQNDRSVGVPQQTQDKSDHDGAKSAQQQISPTNVETATAQGNNKVGGGDLAFQNNNSLTASSEEREKNGYDMLHRLAGSFRKDAYEISQMNCRSLDETATGAVSRRKSAQNRVRGASFMEKDLKTRKKEKIRVVFAISDAEFKQIKRNRQLQQSTSKQQQQVAVVNGGGSTNTTVAPPLPHSARPAEKTVKAPANSSSFSIVLKLTDQPGGESTTDPMASRKSADHANQGMRYGGSFHIPIMPCQIESSESEDQAAQLLSMVKQQQKDISGHHMLGRPQKQPNSRKQYLPGQNSFNQIKSSTKLNLEREEGRPEDRRNNTQIILAKPQVTKAASLNKVTSADEKQQLVDERQKLLITKQTSSLISSSSSSSDACSPADGGRSSLFYDYDNQMKLQIEEHHHLYSPSAESNNRVSKVRNTRNPRPNLALKLNKIPNYMMHQHNNNNNNNDDDNYSGSNMLMLEHNSHRHEMLSQKSPSPRQQNELIGPTASGGYCSPDKDGGHTERTHNKGRTLRFNLHQCDLQGSSTNEQVSSMHHHRFGKTLNSSSRQSAGRVGGTSNNLQQQQYMAEKSFDNMDQHQHQDSSAHYWRNYNNFDATSTSALHQQAAASQDSKSVACNSECRSEHYIRAKKFAALRTNQKMKKGAGGVDSTLSFQQNNNKSCSQLRKHSPPQHVTAADSSSLYILPQESDSLRNKAGTTTSHQQQQQLLQASSHEKAKNGNNIPHPLYKKQISGLIQQRQASEPQSAGVHSNQLQQQQCTNTGNLTARDENKQQSSAAVVANRMIMQSLKAAQYNSPVQTTSINKNDCESNKVDENTASALQPALQQSNRQQYNQTSDSIKILPAIKALQNDKDTSYFSTVKEATIETSENQRNLHCTAITPNNLNKINENFSNFAKELGDETSDDDGDWHEYLSKQMNVSHQSPMEFQKRLRCNSKDEQHQHQQQFYQCGGQYHHLLDSASASVATGGGGGGGKSVSGSCGMGGGLLLICSATKTREPMTGTKKKSILKNSVSNQLVKERSLQDEANDYDEKSSQHQEQLLLLQRKQKRKNEALLHTYADISDDNNNNNSSGAPRTSTKKHKKSSIDDYFYNNHSNQQHQIKSELTAKTGGAHQNSGGGGGNSSSSAGKGGMVTALTAIQRLRSENKDYKENISIEKAVERQQSTGSNLQLRNSQQKKKKQSAQQPKYEQQYSASAAIVMEPAIIKRPSLHSQQIIPQQSQGKKQNNIVSSSSPCNAAFNCSIDGAALHLQNSIRRQSCQLTHTANSSSLKNGAALLSGAAAGQHHQHHQPGNQHSSNRMMLRTTQPHHLHQFHSAANIQFKQPPHQHQYQHQQNHLNNPPHLQQRNREHLVSEFLKNYHPPNHNQSASSPHHNSSTPKKKTNQGGEAAATDPHYQTFGRAAATASSPHNKFDLDGDDHNSNSGMVGGLPLHQKSTSKQQVIEHHTVSPPNDSYYQNQIEDYQRLNNNIETDGFVWQRNKDNKNPKIKLYSSRAVRFPSPPAAMHAQKKLQKNNNLFLNRASTSNHSQKYSCCGDHEEQEQQNHDNDDNDHDDEATTSHNLPNTTQTMRRFYLQNLSPQKSTASNQDYDSPSGRKSLIKMSNPHTGMTVQSLSPPPMHKTISSAAAAKTNNMLQYESGQSSSDCGGCQYHHGGSTGGRNVSSQLGNYMSNNDQQLMIAHKRQLLISQPSSYQQRYHGGTFGRPANTNGTNDENDGNSSSGYGKPQTTLSEMIIPMHVTTGAAGCMHQQQNLQQQLSEEQLSTGVAFFGGASSSGNGGGVPGGLQTSQSNAGFSPQAHHHLMPSAGFEYPPMMLMAKEAGDDFDDEVVDREENNVLLNDHPHVVDDSQGATTTAAGRPPLSSNHHQIYSSQQRRKQHHNPTSEGVSSISPPGRRRFSSQQEVHQEDQQQRPMEIKSKQKC